MSAAEKLWVCIWSDMGQNEGSRKPSYLIDCLSCLLYLLKELCYLETPNLWFQGTVTTTTKPRYLGYSKITPLIISHLGYSCILYIKLLLKIARKTSLVSKSGTNIIQWNLLTHSYFASDFPLVLSNKQFLELTNAFDDSLKPVCSLHSPQRLTEF